MSTYDQMLASTPTDPAMAVNYPELFALWKKATDDNHLRADASVFDAWDKQVQPLLAASELQFYLSPYHGSLDLAVLDNRAVSRTNHLTKILLYRHGIKAEGDGFNG
ncbi:hypothetical protein [Bradyrhizobium sp. BWC-3-1]|uniref:hypothetical protein n=1 Tax=Bradyrhizobium sp. BWC-3-1 TaxID=3080012 RepID=UPI00293F24DE|nr:hypothetical protein [Bradyrhizobium sp. BWC-3-1]WOH55052.1 hypothetical protein RX329_22260 [Bradyrhizobium sp. BWC-3-1]